MRQQDDEMPEEYKQHLAKLTECLEARERYSTQMKDLPPHAQAEGRMQLGKFDQSIDELETLLAAEYERHQSAKAKEAQLAEKVAEAWEASKRIYLMVKHQTPHLLESYTKQVLDPMPPDLREEFLDEAAILEATKLDAILKGED